MTKLVKQEWLSKKKCKKCGSRLRMVEYGDWGICTNKECFMVWNMFMKPKKEGAMSKEDGIVQSGDDIVNVKFGGGMELQQLHNTAVSILFNRDKYATDLSQAAHNYLLNLFISATDALGKPIGGQHE